MNTVRLSGGMALAVIWTGAAVAGIYSGPTDDAAFSALQSQVENRYAVLTNKMAEAAGLGLNTDYAQTSEVTVRYFKDIYAPWDRSNPTAIQAKYDANTWKSQHDPVGPLGLPFDELADCIEVADAAVAELQDQIDGAVVLQDTPDFSAGGISLNGTHYEQNGRTVFPHYFFWHPFDEDLMQAYGRMGEGYYALTDMSSSNTVINWRQTGLQMLTGDQEAANRAPMQFFLGHYASDWFKTMFPEAFSAGGRLFTEYDIDYPHLRGWISELISRQLAPAISQAGSQERIHMIANEPVWSIRKGGVDADRNLSGYTYSKFEAWLEDRYSTIGNLNAVWGTAHADINTAASAHYTINEGVDTALQGSAIWYDWCRFNMSRVNDWFAFLHNEVKAVDPVGRTHIKVMGERAVHARYHDEGIDFEFINDLVDLPGSDNQMTSRRAWESEYYQRLDDGGWYERYNLEWIDQSFMIDFVKSLNPEKGFYDSEWHGLSGARWRDFHMEPAYVREALWLAFTHGVSAMNAWVWCRYDGTESWPAGAENGQPQNGSDFFGEAATQPLLLDAWGRTMKELNAHADTIRALVPVQRRFMLWYSQDCAIQDAEYTEKLSRVYEALKLLNVPVGFTTASRLDSLNPAVQTLILSPTGFVSDVDLADLQAFESAGGKIVLVDPAASFLKDEYGVLRSGGSGITGSGGVAYGEVFALADDLSAVLNPMKPDRIVDVEITNTSGDPDYGVLCQQAVGPDGVPVISLINVSKEALDIELGPAAVSEFGITNRITETEHPRVFRMEPMDVHLLSLHPVSDGWKLFQNSFGLSGGRTNNADGDLLNDWGEYIFDGNPTNSADTGVAPFIDPVSGEYVFQVRNDTSLVARVVSTTNLLTGMWITNATFNMDVNDFAMGTNRSPIADGPQQFIKLLVNDVETEVTEVPGYRLLIGGLQGNGDFESGSPTSGPHPYEDTASWFNGSGSESENAVNDTQMNGCSQSGSHGGLPVDDRLMLNRAGYTVSAPGEVFSLRYEFGAGGGTANWNGDEVMYAYVCFVPVGVGAETTEADLTVLGSDAYSVNRALDGQWTTRVLSNLYTTSAADVGRALYLGLEFEQGSGADLYPRIDVIQWEVNK